MSASSVTAEKAASNGASAPTTPSGAGHSWSTSHRFIPRVFVRPLLRFMHEEAAGGIVMLAAALAALVWANSSWHAAYEALWETHLSISLGEILHLDHLTLRDWVNDALMAIFFFVVGLEIKREIALGELRDPRALALPAAAALGGMIVPALLFVGFNIGGAGIAGWGVPMATDIAFAVGILSLLGNRVPIAAKLFLLTVAVVDDIGAILVIALFYTGDLAFGWLIAALAGLLLVAGLNRADVRSGVPYLVLGGFVWLALLESGVHATLAGVTLGLMCPSRPFYDPRRFASTARPLIDDIEKRVRGGESPDATAHIHASLTEIVRLSSETVSPLDRIVHRLHLWSAFVVIPIFAFANAGVRFAGGSVGELLGSPVVVGVFVGLLAGKTLGICATTWLAVRCGLGVLPRGTTFTHVIGLGLCAGVGFTVALFIATLAFEDPAMQASAKIGIFAASAAAGALGYAWLRLTSARSTSAAAADEVPACP